MLRYKKGTRQHALAGKDLAGGHFATLFSLVGDLDYFFSVLDLPNSRSAGSPCTLCNCSKHGEFSWRDFRTGAAWRTTCYGPNEWHGLESRSSCPLFSLPHLSGVNVAYDWLHCKYLGSDQYTYAGLLYLLTFHMLPGRPEANIRQIWSDILDVYKSEQTHVRFRYLNSLRMFVRVRGGPKLRGKGAEIKYLASPMLRIWEKYMNAGLQIHNEIKVMLKLNLVVENLLIQYRGEVSLGPDARQFQDALDGMLALQSKIASHFQQHEERAIFSITEKSHYLQHSAMLARYLSPRLVWAFSGEDQQKRVQTLGKASVKGLGPSKAGLKIASRYRAALHFQFLKHL